MALQLQVQRLHTAAQVPRYGRPGDAGLDLFSIEEHTLGPGERHVFGAGVAVAIPAGYVGLIWDRSGLGAKGITSLGGVVDATYRGEIKVTLVNTSGEPYRVLTGDRIAQLLVQAIPTVVVEEAGELATTVRGSNGFGSSGR